MRFREAVKVCFQDYYNFSGRARRPEYWWFILFCLAGSVLLSAVDRVIFGPEMLLGLSGLFALLTILPQIAVAWRRMHDIGRPGFLNLLPGLPLVPVLTSALRDGSGVPVQTAAVLLGLSGLLSLGVAVLLMLPSQPGRNKYDAAAPE